MKTSLSVAIGLALCALVPAQEIFVTSPAGGLTQEGYSNSFYVGLWAQMRWQQIDGELTGQTYSIRDVAFRLDGRNHMTANAMGRSWTNVTLKLSETSKYSVMSATYTQNITKPQTTVYSSKHDFSTQSGVPLFKPDIWGGLKGKLRFPFTTPWAYTGKDSILVDFTFRGGTLANRGTWTGFQGSFYYLDSETINAVVKGSTVVSIPAALPSAPCHDSAITETAASSNAFAWGSAFAWGPSASNANYRNSLSVEHYSKFTAPAAKVIHAVGLGGYRAGVNIGARCNALYVDLTKPHLLVPVTTDLSGFAGFTPWLVPWTAALASMQIYVQAAWADSRTQHFSLTSAVRVTFPNSLPPPGSPLRKATLGYSATAAVAHYGPGTGEGFNPFMAYRIR